MKLSSRFCIAVVVYYYWPFVQNMMAIITRCVSRFIINDNNIFYKPWVYRTSYYYKNRVYFYDRRSDFVRNDEN